MMKALAFLSLSNTLRSGSDDHPWRLAQKTTTPHPRKLSPTPPARRWLTAIPIHHDAKTRWLASTSFLRCSNYPCDENNDGTININNIISEVPFISRCGTSNDSHHIIYRMNTAALQLFMQQRHLYLNAGKSARDLPETSRNNDSTDSTDIFIDSIINCTKANDDASSSTNGYYDPEVYFVAIQTNNNSNSDMINKDTKQPQSTSNDSGNTSPNKKRIYNINDLISTNNTSTIIGITTIQLRHKSPLIAGSSTDVTSGGENDLPAVALPTPHYYILNVQVNEQFRGCGVGSSLLASVVEYCRCQCERSNQVVDNDEDDHDMNENLEGYDLGVQMSSIGEGCSSEKLLYKLKQRRRNRRRNKSHLQHYKVSGEEVVVEEEEEEEEIPIVLSVDTDNTPALRLYEKFGFEYLEQNSVFCIMMLQP